jgi:hypothetical protein
MGLNESIVEYTLAALCDALLREPLNGELSAVAASST